MDNSNKLNIPMTVLPACARQKGAISLKDELLQIGKQCAALPILDNRGPEEILGYNKDGEPLLFKGHDFSKTDIKQCI